MPRPRPPKPATYLKLGLPSPVGTPWPACSRVPFLYFPPACPSPPKPAVVVLHSYGSSKEEYAPIGPHLRRLGYAGLLPDLPFHGERAVAGPSGPGGRARLFPFQGDLSLYVLAAKQMIADAVACLGWLARRAEIDPSRLVAIGFSLGGIVTSVLAGLGLGLRAVVAVSAAGDWGDVI